MGMRGTVSPGFVLTAVFDESQVLPLPFADIAARVMVPWSHILWASCWYGLALEAFARARRAARRRRGAPDLRLADAARSLSLLKASITEAIDHLVPARTSVALFETARLNDLKVSASHIAVDVAETSLEICGMAGYQERSPLSVARILRDLYSARLMVANDRILTTNAHLALARSA
jgi:acyl-CoA dehydrogenase